ncbi:DNA polymerase IV [Alpinimonas psychrophila]|uniref:DNA polymerase IV n=1 Tax=Alpinimonas psychrophila TaxID=748908 RepID=A0A7W3JTB1_9MICO|nr:DNA polymerase IV [Alpinimonas psychrophila]MBA8828835.1 DNA polymerase-4 [Alpinimonas psychrophila]
MSQQPSGANILHIDMDAFFASVELLDHPEAVGLPAVVAHNSSRSVVTSATYEARALGIRSAMALSMAKRICATVIVLEPHRGLYTKYSAMVMAIFRDFTPLVEPLSIDEAFLDVSGARRLLGSPVQIATEIRRRVLAETGLTCSVGIASTKFMAKLASTKSKPNGLLVVEPENTLAFLRPLPINALWGVGAKTAEVLKRRGLHTVGEVADTPVTSLVSALGESAGRQLHELSWGRDPRLVSTERSEKSIGREHTFETDVRDDVALKAALLDQSARVAGQLRHAGLEARTVGLKVTFSDFTSLTRSRTLSDATSVGREIHRTVVELLDELKRGSRSVRLIGVRASALVEEGGQAFTLWEDEDDAWRDAEIAVDQVAEKFGRNAVMPASLMRTMEETRESGIPG